MTPVEWVAGFVYFGGIALGFYAAALVADLWDSWFPERKDTDE